MIDVGKFPWTIAVPGSGALQFPMPGALLVGGLCSLALLGQSRAARLLQVPVERALRDGLDVMFQAGALVEDKHLAFFLLFGASIPLRNRFVEQTARSFVSFGVPVAACSRFRQQSDIAIAIAIGSLSAPKVGLPIANGP